MRTLIEDVYARKGTSVQLQGWIQEIRNLSKVKFVILRDRTGDMQCIALKGKTPDAVFESIAKLTKESVISLTGQVTENKESRWGVEILITDISVINESAAVLPIDNTDKSKTEIEKRLDYRFLDTRNKKVHTIFSIRSKIARILTDFFDEEKFTNINTPKITRIGVESGASLFEVNYFGDSAYLSQSPQIYKQMFVAGGFERVFELGVVFRAENSNTTRHLTEFTGIDFEMGFINDFTDVMDMIEKMMLTLLRRLKAESAEQLALLNITLDIPEHVPRITMREAKDYLRAKGKILSEDDDFDAEAERMVGEWVKEKYTSDLVFITHYPWKVRPFYHMRTEGKPDETKSFDMLYRGVEIATGAQREHRLDVLQAQAEEKGVNFEEMEAYANIFKYGIPPHGGVGFGLDRITQRLLDIGNIREVVLLPRDPKRVSP
ncbi:MAG: aspartate--tRNA(Asn) ligase [archaeon]